MTESDGTDTVMLPQEARLRNLTYAMPVYVLMQKRVFVAVPNDKHGEVGADTKELRMEEVVAESDPEPVKVFIGKVPIMVRSSRCVLNGLLAQDLYDVHECP